MLRRLTAPLTTFVSVSAVVLLFLALGLKDGVNGADDAAFATAWTVWKFSAALAVVVFLTTLMTAAHILGEPGRWGVAEVLGQRRAYLLLASAAMALLVLLKVLGPTFEPESPVSALGVRTNVVLFAGLASAAPWLVLVWLGFDAVRALDIPRLAASPQAGIRILLRLWRLLVACTGAFAVGVVAALLTSGALRNAMLADDPDREDFPATNVLLYGAVFAVFLTILILPFAVAWRAKARQFVTELFDVPPDGVVSEAWTSERGRLEHLLRLDAGLLRSPLTALSIFTPLVTSLLAAFVPQLAT